MQFGIAHYRSRLPYSLPLPLISTGRIRCCASSTILPPPLWRCRTTVMRLLFSGFKIRIIEWNQNLQYWLYCRYFALRHRRPEHRGINGKTVWIARSSVRKIHLAIHGKFIRAPLWNQTAESPAIRNNSCLRIADRLACRPRRLIESRWNAWFIWV